MMTPLRFFILGMLLLDFHCAAQNQSVNALQQGLNYVSAKLISNEISRIEVLCLPVGDETRAKVNAAWLEHNHRGLEVLNLESNEVKFKALGKSLSQIHPVALSSPPDLRLGLKFIDKNGKQMFSIYLDRSGQGGMILNEPAWHLERLQFWLESNLKGNCANLYTETSLVIVSNAISNALNSPLTEEGRAAGAILLAFAEESKKVRVVVSSKVMPWLRIDIPENFKAALLGAYVAGDIQAQFGLGIPSDDPYAGIVGALRVYSEIRRNDKNFIVAELERLKGMQAESLRKHMEMIQKESGE